MFAFMLFLEIKLKSIFFQFAYMHSGYMHVDVIH
jgi:hypothetical protein